MNTRKTIRKTWYWASILVILAMTLAACGGAEATPTLAPTTAPTEAPPPTEAPTAVPTEAPTPVPAVITVVQDFEAGAEPYDGNQATASLATDIFYTGAQSLKSESTEGEWHTVGVNLGDAPVDFTPFAQLCFFVYDTTTMNNGRASNTVGVKLFDASGASVERYTDNEGVGANPKTRLNEWTLMCMNLISFTGIDQTQVEKIEFTMYWAGVFYFDDLTLVPAGEKLAAPEPPAAGEAEAIDVQTFEAEDTYYTDYQAEVSLDTEIFYDGASSLKAFSESGEWHAFGAYPDPRPIDLSSASKLCFWIYDTTTNNNGAADNTVGVKLFDASGANEEVWTDHATAGENPKTVTNEWVQMCLNIDAYTTVDLSQIDKIQFALYWAGTYYVDGIQAVGAAQPAEPVLVQGFEAEETYYSDYQAEVSLDTEIFHDGASSLKAFSESGEWHAFGAYPDPRPIDLSSANQLCFWIYDTTTNNNGAADNTVGVKLFDASGANEEVWTDHATAGENPKTVTNEWVQMCLNIDAYTAVDLSQIDKIQFALYWAGTYYVDEITFVPGGAKPAAAEPTPEPAAEAPMMSVNIQTFEAEETYYSDYQAEVSLDTEIFHGGISSLKAFSESGEWHAFGAYPDPRPIDLSSASKLCFWIYDTTTNNNGAAENTVGVKLFDASGANEEIWTDNTAAGANPKTVTNEWVQMCLNLSAYTAIDLSQVDKIQFALYWAGTYYVDDIQVMKPVEPATEPFVAQDFEVDETYYSDYQAEVSLDTDIFYGGASSLKAFSESGEWHAFGAYPSTRPFNALPYNKMCFWIYDTTTNNNGAAENTVGVKLFDASGANEEIWTDNAAAGTNPKTVTNEWVQMCLSLSAYTAVDLSQVDKIQFALYWAGTYYVDEITFEP